MKKSKEKERALEELSKDELLIKCKNQRQNIKVLTEVIIELKRKTDFMENFDRFKGYREHRERICFEETMSLFDDIEDLKSKNKKLETENLELKEKLQK